MGNPLRDRRTVAEWASAQQVIEIAEEIASFDDFAAAIEVDLAALPEDKMPGDWRRDTVNGELRFAHLDAEGQLAAVSGAITATVNAVCQRCLEPFRLTLETEPKLLLLSGEETVAGYDEYEVWELDDQTLRPSDIVAELLVMALPFAAMHSDAASCKALTSTPASDDDEKTRPFAALREQMERN